MAKPLNLEGKDPDELVPVKLQMTLRRKREAAKIAESEGLKLAPWCTQLIYAELDRRSRARRTR